MGNSFRFLSLSLYQVDFFVKLGIIVKYLGYSVSSWSFAKLYIWAKTSIDDLKNHYLLACSSFSPGVKGKAVWQTFLLAFVKSQLHSVGSFSSYS